MNIKKFSTVFAPLLTLILHSTCLLAEDKNTNLIQFSADIGVGYDDNIYHAPNANYIDYAQNTPEIIDPVLYSGFYFPIAINVTYQHQLFGKNHLVLDYKGSGRIYQNRHFHNADTHKNTLRAGYEYLIMQKKSRRHSVYSGFLFGHRHKRYIDRDDGTNKIFGNADVSNRYIYNFTGIELEYKNRINKTKYGAYASVQLRDHENPVTLTQYDHQYYNIGGYVNLRLAKPSKLKFVYEYWMFDYDERPSRDASGNLDESHPLNYQYHNFRVTLRQKLSKRWVTFLSYDLKQRLDGYIGYNNYLRHKIHFRLLYELNKRINYKLSLKYWDRNYPNGFAFDNTLDDKHFDGIIGQFKMEYQISAGVTSELKLETRKQNSTDLRYQYVENRVWLTLKYEL